MSINEVARYRPHFIGIFIVSLAVLAYQVLLTRIFSVMLYYHFAFAGISMAMLGLTIGAQIVHSKPLRFSPDRFDSEWAKAALGFALSSIGLMALYIYGPILIPTFMADDEFTNMLVIYTMIIFVIPFIYSGICIALLLTKSPAPVGKLYAVDLGGAALGCLGIVGALFYLDPIGITFGLAALVAFSGWFMCRGSSLGIARVAQLIAVLLTVGFLIQSAAYLTDAAHMRIIYAKGNVLGPVPFERWNNFSLVRVGNGPKDPYGWGFGRMPNTHIDQLGLNIDAGAGTVLTRFDGSNLVPVSYLSDDVINMGYHVRPVHNVAVIGVGGGRDILSALYFGVEHVTGVELNPSIFEALTERFGDFSGHLDRRPEVTLVNAEARSWLNRNNHKFDLIQISLIDTWAATAAGGLSLSESKLYTTEAWEDFMNQLSPQGLLTVSRWFTNTHAGEFYRMLALATTTLEARGVPKNQLRQHLLAFRAVQINPENMSSGDVINLVTSVSPFTPDEVQQAVKAANGLNFSVMLSPDYAWDEISRVIASGDADSAFYDRLPIDVSPSTDNRPFFFHMLRIKDLIDWKNWQGDDQANANNDYSVFVILFMLFSTLVALIFFLFDPYKTLSPRHKHQPAMIGHLTYFGGIGLAFMLIEISQMQRLMIFLGHPVYGLSVILFTLLLFGGIGSGIVNNLLQKSSFPLPLMPWILCLVLTITAFVTPQFTEFFKGSGTPLHILASVILLAPAAIFMGMMFPLGMRASHAYKDLQTWFWSINGATSVFASVLGVVISMEWGISTAYGCGIACYVLCAFLMTVNAKDNLANSSK